MKQVLVLFLLIISATKAKADYGYMSLSELVCIADYGAVGTVVRLDANYFYLKVDAYVLGKLELDTLKIQKFEDWNCGRRHKKYEIGEKELVFFRKSNYVISEYELLGYGAGGEFELPISNDTIYYHFSYSQLKPFLLKNFLLALRDYDQIKQKTKQTARPISTAEKTTFANKSALHKIFIDCNSQAAAPKFDLPQKGYIANLEKNFLYEEYENKLYVFNFEINKIFLSVDNATVQRREGYFTVKPNHAWTRRWVTVYALSDTGKTNALYEQLFEVIELPEPQIYFSEYTRDTIWGGHSATPRVAYYLDDMHKDEFLEYELLNYTYIITPLKGKIETYKMKSAQLTPELRRRIGNLKAGDKVTVKDAYVLYPNKTVKKVRDRTVVIQQ